MRNRTFYSFIVSLIIHATLLSLIIFDFSDVNFKRLLPSIEISPAAVEILKAPEKTALEKARDLVQLFLDSLKDPSRLAKEKNDRLANKEENPMGGFDIRKPENQVIQGNKNIMKEIKELSLPTGQEVANKVVKVVKDEVNEFMEEMGKIKTASKKKEKGQDNKGFKSFVEIVTVSKDGKKTTEDKAEELDPDSLAEAMYIKQQEDCFKNPKTLKYGGIGLSFKVIPNKDNPKEYYSQVDIVPRGYPARKAGMRKGDIVKGNVMRFRGPVGSEVNVDFFRDGVKNVLKMTRAEICYIPENNPVIPFNQGGKKGKH